MCGSCQPVKQVVKVREEPVVKEKAPAIERPLLEPLSLYKHKPLNCEHQHAFCTANKEDVRRTIEGHELKERRVLTTKFVMKTIKRKVMQTVLKRKPTIQYNIVRVDKEITET